MLAAAAGRAELERWPQYAGALVYDSSGKAHIHVGVFQYFVFWTAFYVLKVGRAWLLGWAAGCVGSELEAWSWDCGGRDVCSACLQAGVCVRAYLRSVQPVPVCACGAEKPALWCSMMALAAHANGVAGGPPLACRAVTRGASRRRSGREAWASLTQCARCGGSRVSVLGHLRSAAQSQSAAHRHAMWRQSMLWVPKPYQP